MSSVSSTPPLVAILGPTASGKSSLGVWLAEKFGGEVVACDSTQLYRGFEVGTAKPSLAERRGVPHHLLDVLEPGQDATAGGYREMALSVLRDLRARKRLPIFTVGTGLYLRTLLEGLAELPQRSEGIRDRLRKSAEDQGSQHLHRLLRKLDAVTASKIAPADEQKLIRAIEVCLLMRKPLSEIHRQGRTPLQGWQVLKIGLQPSRELLYERIERRTETMLRNGWLAEVQSLMSSGIPANAKPFDFIGYRELRSVAEHSLKLEEAGVAIQQATRRYAKRQLTWFRREPSVEWIVGFGDAPDTQSAALRMLYSAGMAPIRSA